MFFFHVFHVCLFCNFTIYPLFLVFLLLIRLFLLIVAYFFFFLPVVSHFFFVLISISFLIYQFSSVIFLLDFGCFLFRFSFIYIFFVRVWFGFESFFPLLFLSFFFPFVFLPASFLYYSLYFYKFLPVYSLSSALPPFSPSFPPCIHFPKRMEGLLVRFGLHRVRIEIGVLSGSGLSSASGGEVCGPPSSRQGRSAEV